VIKRPQEEHLLPRITTHLDSHLTPRMARRMDKSYLVNLWNPYELLHEEGLPPEHWTSAKIAVDSRLDIGRRLGGSWAVASERGNNSSMWYIHINSIKESKFILTEIWWMGRESGQPQSPGRERTPTIRLKRQYWSKYTPYATLHTMTLAASRQYHSRRFR
jgi:hypothetical protein